MTRVLFSNHTAVRAPRSERERIRTFYRDVLGCTLMREFDDKDDFRIGDDFYLAFLYAAGSAAEVGKGVTYAADDALNHDDFLKATFLELNLCPNTYSSLAAPTSISEVAIPTSDHRCWSAIPTGFAG